MLLILASIHYPFSNFSTVLFQSFPEIWFYIFLVYLLANKFALKNKGNSFVGNGRQQNCEEAKTARAATELWCPPPPPPPMVAKQSKSKRYWCCLDRKMQKSKRSGRKSQNPRSILPTLKPNSFAIYMRTTESTATKTTFG